MTLQDIRTMRLQRVKPTGVVSVVVGHAGKSHKSDPTVIELKPGAQPGLMDWRPTVGLWVAFYHLETDWPVMDAAIAAADAAGAKLFGYAGENEGHSLCDFKNPADQQKAERLLRKGLEILCH